MSNFISRLFRKGLGQGHGNDTYTRPIDTTRNEYQHTYMGLDVDPAHKEYVTPLNAEFEVWNTTPEVKIAFGKGAELFSNGRWVVKDYKTNEKIENHPLIKLLEKPNPIQSRNEFLSELYINYRLYGNDFVYLNYAMEGLSQYPSSMTNIQVPMVALRRSGKYMKQTTVVGIIEKYLITDKRNRDKILEEIDPEFIVHLKTTNPNDPLLGLSILGSLHMPISNIRSGRGYVNADYSKKGAHGIVSSNSKDSGGALPLMENDRLDLEKQYAEKTHGGFDGQSSVIISSKPVTWTNISSAIKEHMITEVNELEFKRIIDSIGLNEALFSFMRQSTFSNQKNGEIQAYQNGIFPFSENVGFAMTDKMDLIEKEGVYIELDYSHVPALQVDELAHTRAVKTKAETFKILVENGIDINEARTISGI